MGGIHGGVAATGVIVHEAAFRAAEGRYLDLLGVEVEERWVMLPSGSRVRVQSLGDGPPALVVHGVNTAGVMLAGLAALVPSRRCHVVDRPGCGLITTPTRPAEDERSFFEYVDGLVPDVLDGLGIDSATVLSTSMGGLFAFRTAATTPDRVNAVVHAGWSMGAPLQKLPLAMRPANTRLGAKLMSMVPVPRVAVEPMLKNIGLRAAFDEGNVPDELVDAMYALLRHTDTMRNEVLLGPLVLDELEATVINDDMLAQITAPTLILWGTDDPMGGPDVARSFAARIPNAELEILEGAGHAPWLDAPQVVARRIAAFLTGLEAPE